jgi:hypothetical protein
MARFLVWIAMLLGTAAGHAEVIDRVIAMVGDRAITLSDLRAAVELGLVDRRAGQEGDAAALRDLIDRTIVVQEVARYGPGAAAEAEVARRVNEISNRLGEKELEAVMARCGLDEPRLRALIRDEIAIERYLDDRFGAAAQPTDDEVQRYYREHPEAFTRDGRLLPFPEAEEEARATLTAQRRRRLIEDWIAGLRRRTDITILEPTLQ